MHGAGKKFQLLKSANLAKKSGQISFAMENRNYNYARFIILGLDIYLDLPEFFLNRKKPDQKVKKIENIFSIFFDYFTSRDDLKFNLLRLGKTGCSSIKNFFILIRAKLLKEILQIPKRDFRNCGFFVENLIIFSKA